MTLTPDPHGQAALMLCESLMLVLVEDGIINKDRTVETIENVIEVKQEIARGSESIVVSVASIGLLQGVVRSITAASEPRPRAVS